MIKGGALVQNIAMKGDETVRSTTRKEDEAVLTEEGEAAQPIPQIVEDGTAAHQETWIVGTDNTSSGEFLARKGTTTTGDANSRLGDGTTARQTTNIGDPTTKNLWAERRRRLLAIVVEVEVKTWWSWRSVPMYS
jgi:hypothetical protein